eukprot:Gb_26049 [translate_table: standard]
MHGLPWRITFSIMALAVPTNKLAWPFHCHCHHSLNKFRCHKFIYMRFFVDHVDVQFIHASTSTVKQQFTQTSNCKSQAMCMSDSNIPASFDSLLRACTNVKALHQMHTQLLIAGFGESTCIKNKLVCLYAMFNSMEFARLLFDKLCKPNVFLWNLMIGGYARNGPLEEALTLYHQMQQSGIQPNKFTFPAVLKACAGLSILQEGKDIHDHIVRTGYESDVFVGNSLISMYAKCGSIQIARDLFDRMPKRDVVSWNAMIDGYTQTRHAIDALTLFSQMQLADVVPDSVTMVAVLQACAHIGALQQGKWIHDYIIRSGLELDVSVGNSLVVMYAKCSNVQVARKLFDKMSKRNVVSWNAMIAGYAQNGLAKEALILFNRMRLDDVKSDSPTIASLLLACADLEALRQAECIHGFTIKNGLESDVVVGTALMHTYAKCSTVELARSLFDKMPQRNLVSWSAMIAGYVQNGHSNEALALFNKLLEDMKPNSVTMVSVLLACAQLGALQQGESIHGYIIRSGFELDVVVGTALVDMYAKCKNIEIARHFFDKMPIRNVVSWNAMAAGYTQNGHANEALTLFNQMQLEDMKPNSVTIASALSACSHSGALQQGKWIHDYIVQNGFELDVLVENSLIAMYASCGNVEVARQLFDNMSKRNVVSWNTMIAGYVQSGDAKEALALFNQMQLAETTPDLVTIVSVLPACAHLAALQQGKWIHAYILRCGFKLDVVTGTALIDMYTKCGSIELARRLFDKMSKRNVVSWNAIIAGYGMHGHGEDALALFSEMQETGMKPDHITFVCVLSACSHAGLVDKGWQYFGCMNQDYCIPPRMEHYACMVDLLGRAGRLDDAQDFIEKMPLEPGASVWGALLAACRIHGNIELGVQVAKRVFDLEPENSGFYVLLSNIYAAAGKWEDVVKVRMMMKERGVKKTPGWSLIEVGNRVHAFLVGDRSHPQSEKIYAALGTLARQMEVAGYVPNINFGLHDVDEE